MIKNYPKITIITPSYNQGKYIEQTILSILNQNYINLEYIIIDGGSTDNTIDIIKKYESKIHYWVSEPDKGQAHALNKGLQKASGEIFNWINSDDYLEPEALQHIAQAFMGNPQPQVVCGYTHCFYDETGETSHTYRMGLKKTVGESILYVEMNQPGTFYKTSIVKQLGGINESLRYVFDDELWFKYLSAFGLKNISFIDQLICHFRLHKNSKSVGEGFELFWYELKDIRFEIAKQLEIPNYLRDHMQRDLINAQYRTQPWDIHCIEKYIYFAAFAHEYMYTLYKEFDYSGASDCMKLTIKTRNVKFTRQYLLLFIKVFLIPHKLLSLLRKAHA